MLIFFVITLPLIAAICAGFLGRYIGRQGAAIITISSQFFVCLCILSLLIKSLKYGITHYVTLGTWINVDILNVNWTFYGDTLTLMLAFIVTLVSTVVHLYSYEYMKTDPHQPKFFAYLSLFTFFMIVLLTGDNLLILFVGWEGVGVCSYLLINFWSSRIQANKSAMKAMILNRVGDFALTMGIILCFKVFKSVEFAVIFPLAPYFVNTTVDLFFWKIGVIDLICIFMFLGAVGKSAQIGLHMWLPDAMEGPTPVSALIHAATMVTAGVFLIIKCSPLFELVPNVLVFMTLLGSLTLFISATIGLVQHDVKKIIAYSTCSQLGYMVMACGLSNYAASFFHLINHAFFKALLFLSAGALIHSLSNEQDLRKYGGLIKLLPFTAMMFFIGSMALTGFPFTTGYYSKDLIIEIALTKFTISSHLAYNFAVITAFITTLYSLRVFYLIFLGTNRSFRQVVVSIHELPVLMAISLGVLAIGSIFFGYLTKDLFVGVASDAFINSIYVLPENNSILDAEFYGLPQNKLNSYYYSTIIQNLMQHNVTTLLAINKNWTIYYVFMVFGWIYLLYSLSLFSIIQNNFRFWILTVYYNVYLFLSEKWFFDQVLKIIVYYCFFIVSQIYKWVDKGWIEQLGPKGLAFFVNKVSTYQLQKVTGFINQAAQYASVYILLLLFFLLWFI